MAASPCSQPQDTGVIVVLDTQGHVMRPVVKNKIKKMENG
jgi:hypothetical protein